VGDPVDWAAGVFREDLLEGFEDGEADLAFVEASPWWEGAYAVAWELGDEEGEV
jgi:hypothetical protein